MVSEPALESMAEFLDLGEGDRVLEIGPGLGFLTEVLARKAHVRAVELDKRFCVYLRERFKENPRIEVVESDILAYDFAGQEPGVKCAGNVPYQISSPLVEKLQEHRRLWADVVLTFQKDFAVRLTAKEGSRDRSPLSCWVQMHAEIRMLKDLKREDFFPPPKVDSSVVRLVFYEKPLYPAEDGEAVRKCIKTAFQQRRKTLANAATGLFTDKKHAEAALREASVDPSLRPENLTLDDWINLGRGFRQYQ